MLPALGMKWLLAKEIFTFSELTKQLIIGSDPQKAIDKIADKFNVSKRQAGTLVMTESAAIASEASKDCMKDLGVEEYEISATLDSHTSEICQGMDGKHFKMSEYEPGVTAPPFHPNCRSTTVPYSTPLAVSTIT